jgi:hypothetical protein
MFLEGTIHEGAIVLEHGEFPEGARVEVSVIDPTPDEETAQPTLTFLLKYAGCMPDLPADFAEQHDHYIHGTPKR